MGRSGMSGENGGWSGGGHGIGGGEPGRDGNGYGGSSGGGGDGSSNGGGSSGGGDGSSGYGASATGDRRGSAVGSFGDFGLADALSESQTNYGGVLDGAPSGIEGYGIGDSMPGMPDKDLTAQETSRGGRLSGGFDKGYGLESAVSEIGKNSRRGLLGQLAHEAKLGAGATKARDISMLSNITKGISDHFSKPDDPVSRASFEQVRDHGLTPTENAIANLGSLALNSLGVPGFITSGVKAMVDAKRQTDYANAHYGLPDNDRRNTAREVFGSRSPSGSSQQQIAATAPASIAPDVMAVPDYDSWSYGTHLNQFST